MGSPIDDKLGRALGKLARSGGQFVSMVGYPNPLPAVITNPETDVAYMMGMSIQDNKIQIRIERCLLDGLPTINSVVTVDGRKWRITRINPYPASVLLQCEDTKN